MVLFYYLDFGTFYFWFKLGNVETIPDFLGWLQQHWAVKIKRITARTSKK
jgi:hypothetical protein